MISELEDYLGEGFLELIRSLGSQLLELNVSCSSDPESPISMDQLSGPAGQQGQLFNAALLAIGMNSFKLDINSYQCCNEDSSRFMCGGLCNGSFIGREPASINH